MTWHYLQISDVLDREFCSALSKVTEVTAWQPITSNWGWMRRKESEVHLIDPPLRVRQFPLQRGFARPPISWLMQFGQRQTERLLRHCSNPSQTPLVCSTPYYAPVAEQWPGPVVYYLTDLIAAYDGASASVVHELDRRMCRAAKLVCPNSSRLADYLTSQAGCDPSKIEVIPNATRQSNLLAALPAEAAPLPADLEALKRPVAGVIGNLSANMDWLFLQALIENTPEYSWAFVGPTSMQISDLTQREARKAVMNHARTRFVGAKPYGELASYARCFDVAVLPYCKREPTYSGSSTRFYEHLAACRPMIATAGFEELLRKEPLLRIVDSPVSAAEHLKKLQDCNFVDGHSHARWLASQDGSWEVRARAMHSALGKRAAFAESSRIKSKLNPPKIPFHLLRQVSSV